jgi:hypothetical protein
VHPSPRAGTSGFGARIIAAFPCSCYCDTLPHSFTRTPSRQRRRAPCECDRNREKAIAGTPSTTDGGNMQIETVDMQSMLAPSSSSPAEAARYLFDREDLVQQLIKLATEQFHAHNEPAAHQLCSAAYVAGIPRDRSSTQYPTLEDFWSAFKQLARASQPGSKVGGSA